MTRDELKPRNPNDADEALLALEAVLATISHDLRTPLAVVHTTTSMLLNPKYSLTAEQMRAQHERIRRNVDVMNGMIGDLADMVNLRSGNLSIDRKPTIVDEVLREAVRAQEATARDKGLQLTYDSGAEALSAAADRARLLQLFQNLLGNALKVTQAGGSITVTSRTDGENVLIEFADGGPGIPGDALSHVFDPYHAAGNPQQKNGAGLGLHIAKGIVDAHGGTIRCTSQPGVGTTFSITLPLTA